MKINKIVIAIAVCFLLIGTYIVPIEAGGGFHRRCYHENIVKVMTRNMYLGGNIFEVVNAIKEDPGSIPFAVASFFQTVQQTNIDERAEALADEILLYEPHLIGLQEVSTYLTQSPGDFFAGNFSPNADFEVIDYITILMDKLKARKLKYKIAASVTNADVEVPMVTESGIIDDLRMIDHDYILIRKDVLARNPVANNFSINAGLDIDLTGDGSGDVRFEFTRGFVAIDAKVCGQVYRFINTHLETGGDEDFKAVQAAQMHELLTILSVDTRPLPFILVGDLNSDPEHTPFMHDIYGLVVPPYMQAIEYAEYLDIWDVSDNWGDGLTCCFNDTVDNPDFELYERVDHIFLLLRGRTTDRIVARVIGNNNSYLTPTGLWPSDHAGVVANIKFIHESHRARYCSHVFTNANYEIKSFLKKYFKYW
jgi:endonuclease/exonuclease/phosphatase family metal-dependent hydrolase